MRLENKIAIITGASRGIGFAVATAFAREGASVALCGSRQSTADSAAQRLEELVPGAKILPLGVDVSDGAAIGQMVQSVVDHFGRIDILVNNAGSPLPSRCTT